VTNFEQTNKRIQTTFRIDRRLAERADAYGEEHGLNARQVIELALAEFFAIPPAVEGVELPIALCAACEQGIVANGRCSVCGWRPVDKRRSLTYNKAMKRAFWEKVDKNGPVPDVRPELGPCWLWQGSKNDRGYGQAWVYDHVRYAHAASWEAEHGPVPPGRQLDHLCRRPLCVRPSHLEPVTAAENMRRSIRTKLTADQVAEIRTSGESNSAVARRLGVSNSHVCRIRQGLVWR
jgi:hypothetical protein